MMVQNHKRSYLLQRYKPIIENRQFDEIDLIGFLITIRSIVFYEKGKYPNIWEICCFIAHPDRDAGTTQKGFLSAKENGYKTKPGTNIVDKHNGIKEESWYKEWKKLGKDIGFSISKEVIKEISICVLSILQGSRLIKDDIEVGSLKLLYSIDSIGLCTTEGKPDSKFIGYFVVNNLQCLLPTNECEITEAIYAERQNGVLHLVTESNRTVT